MSAFNAQIARFCQLAQRGAHPAASSGERIAHRLAAALHTIGDNIMLLDDDAVQGFCLLTQLAAGPFHTDDSKAIVFDTIAKAAGQ